MGCIDPGFGAGQKKLFQSFMLEFFDHNYSVTYNVAGCKGV